MINKKPSLPTLESWLQNTEACAGAVEWIAGKKEVLNKIKSDVEKTNTYNMEASIYALEQFVTEGSEKLQWANWYIVRIMEKGEYDVYGQFALEQMPKDYDQDKCYYKEAVKSLKEAIDNDDSIAIQNVVICVMNANKQKGIDQYEVLKPILKYSIDILKQRKMKTPSKEE